MKLWTKITCTDTDGPNFTKFYLWFVVRREDPYRCCQERVEQQFSSSQWFLSSVRHPRWSWPKESFRFGSRRHSWSQPSEEMDGTWTRKSFRRYRFGGEHWVIFTNRNERRSISKLICWRLPPHWLGTAVAASSRREQISNNGEYYAIWLLLGAQSSNELSFDTGLVVILITCNAKVRPFAFAFSSIFITLSCSSRLERVQTLRLRNWIHTPLHANAHSRYRCPDAAPRIFHTMTNSRHIFTIAVLRLCNYSRRWVTSYGLKSALWARWCTSSRDIGAFRMASYFCCVSAPTWSS